MNGWLARFAFLPCVHAPSLWRVAHNKLHHGRTNLKGYDPVWAPMSVAEYARASRPRRALERVLRSGYGPLFYYYYAFWLSRLLFPFPANVRAEWKRHLPDTLFALTGWIATLFAIAAIGHLLVPSRPLWLIVLLGWAIPFAAWNYLVAFTTYVNHTHPSLPWFDNEAAWTPYRANVHGTVHVKMPVDLFPLYTQVMAHPAHHIHPSIPVYRLPQAQAAAKRQYGADIREYTLSIGEYRRILRTCKLFDFEAMCWTDFNGTPTTPCLLP
jgi:omega-6 fatty acid desaturase (delta-12 desaturase)